MHLTDSQRQALTACAEAMVDGADTAGVDLRLEFYGTFHEMSDKVVAYLAGSVENLTLRGRTVRRIDPALVLASPLALCVVVCHTDGIRRSADEIVTEQRPDMTPYWFAPVNAGFGSGSWASPADVFATNAQDERRFNYLGQATIPLLNMTSQLYAEVSARIPQCTDPTRRADAFRLIQHDEWTPLSLEQLVAACAALGLDFNDVVIAALRST